MDKDQIKLFALSSFGILVSAGLVAAYKAYRKSCRSHKNKRNFKPLDVNEFKKMAKKQGDIVVLRVVPDLENPKSDQPAYYSNERHFCVPDERNYVREAVQIEELRYQGKKWKGRDVNEHGSVIELKGLGEVLDGVLSVDVQPVQTVVYGQLPFYKKLYFLLAGFIQYILGTFYVLLAGKFRSFVFLKGIRIGHFNVKYDWFKGHMLAECEIGMKEQLHVKTVSLSHDLLISKAAETENVSFRTLLISASLWIAVMLAIYKTVKEIQKSEKRKKQEQITLGYRPLAFDGADQSTTCVVCMDHNRNMVFDSCGHLLACAACSALFSQNACPYCKKQIHAKRIFALSSDK